MPLRLGLDGFFFLIARSSADSLTYLARFVCFKMYSLFSSTIIALYINSAEAK